MESIFSVKMKKTKIEKRQICYRISAFIIFVQPTVGALKHREVMLPRGKMNKILFFTDKSSGLTCSVKL